MIHSKFLNRLTIMHTSWIFQVSIMLGITFIVSNHSLFDVGDDLRSNPFKKIRNYKNQQATPYDLLYVLIGPITRAKAKRINIVFNRIIQELWAKRTLRIPSKMTLSIKLSFKDDQTLINVIQITNKQF